jgi:hypothetical protein
VSLELLRTLRSALLPESEKLLLLIIISYSNRDGGGAFPSVPRLARDCGCTDRTIQLRLRRLQARGYLVVERRAAQHRPTTYRIVDPCVHVHGSASKARGEGGFTSDANLMPSVSGESSGSGGEIVAVRGESSVARPDRPEKPVEEQHTFVNSHRTKSSSTAIDRAVRALRLPAVNAQLQCAFDKAADQLCRPGANVAAIDRMLVDAASQSLDREDVIRAAEQELAIYRRRVSSGQYEEMLLRAMQRELRRLARLPDLSRLNAECD